VVWLRLEELKREPCDQKSIVDLALTLDKIGYRRQAADGLYKFVKACGAPASALHRSVDILLKLSDHATAAEVGAESVRRWPDTHDATDPRGTALAGAGDHQRAIVDFANAIELFAQDKRKLSSQVYLRMANSYAALGRHCEAAVPIMTWVAIDPGSRDTS